VLRLRGGASNHDDENDFVRSPGVDDILTANTPLEIVRTAAPVNSPLQPTVWMKDVNEIYHKLSVVKRQIAHSSHLPPNAGPRRSAQKLQISQLNLMYKGLFDDLHSLKRTRVAEIRDCRAKMRKLIPTYL
jgi:hypothetical protein